MLELTLRQIGALYGLPTDLYRQARIPESIAYDLDVIALCRRRINRFQGDVHFALAVRLNIMGSVDVLLPNDDTWTPYAASGYRIGQLFSDARRDRFVDNKRINSQIKLSGWELAQFAARVLTQSINRPTLVVIEADVWRNERGEDGKIWPQLKNEHLYAKRDVLDFSHVRDHTCYRRDTAKLDNVLAIVRLRSGKETPQYITNRTVWHEDGPARDFIHLSGFYDETVPELLHYFSVARLPKTQRIQDTVTARGMYKLDHYIYGKGPRFDEYGANIPFKHQQMVEMVPFFIRPDFQTPEGQRSLCRVLHYLRCSPAWTMGNILLPYPFHLGLQLIEDYLCVLGILD